MILGVFTIPTLITYLGLMCSFSSCIVALNGRLDIALVLFIFAGIFDLFDGMIARKLNKTDEEKSFGIQIDTVIDVFSFGATPIIIGMSVGLNTIADYIIFGIYLMTATMRLAYFSYLSSQKEDDKPVKYYTGLPVTYSALIFPLFFLLKNILSENFTMVLRLVYILVAILYILKVKIVKPKGIWYMIFLLLAIVVSVVTIVLL